MIGSGPRASFGLGKNELRSGFPYKMNKTGTEINTANYVFLRGKYRIFVLDWISRFTIREGALTKAADLK